MAEVQTLSLFSCSLVLVTPLFVCLDARSLSVLISDIQTDSLSIRNKQQADNLVNGVSCSLSALFGDKVAGAVVSSHVGCRMSRKCFCVFTLRPVLRRVNRSTALLFDCVLTLKKMPFLVHYQLGAETHCSHSGF